MSLVIHRRASAIVALTCGAAAFGLLIAQALVDVPVGALCLALITFVLAAMWYGLVERGAMHIAAFAIGLILAAIAAALLIIETPGLALGILVLIGIAVAATRSVFRVGAAFPRVGRPRHPVVIWNPRSGGGKAVSSHLVDEARARGIEPIELTAGADLSKLAQSAIDAGADALAMAGGDGSQAIVAATAAERRIPYACIPAGTRNHFARDLGVDRDDIAGALDAFVDGVERRVDLGEVNGRTFVNNVSLGVYGAAVQKTSYRDAKLKTVVETALAPSDPMPLRWRSADGVEHTGAAAIVISNNAYGPGAEGARPRLDAGCLGVTAIAAPGDAALARSWSTASYRIDASMPVPAGVDGEAVMLAPPLVFGIRRKALRCRLARHHPGASAATAAPLHAWTAFRELVAIALSRPAPESLPNQA